MQIKLFRYIVLSLLVLTATDSDPFLLRLIIFSFHSDWLENTKLGLRDAAAGPVVV